MATLVTFHQVLNKFLQGPQPSLKKEKEKKRRGHIQANLPKLSPPTRPRPGRRRLIRGEQAW